jgi:hypothetical protein
MRQRHRIRRRGVVAFAAQRICAGPSGDYSKAAAISRKLLESAQCDPEQQRKTHLAFFRVIVTSGNAVNLRKQLSLEVQKRLSRIRAFASPVRSSRIASSVLCRALRPSSCSCCGLFLGLAIASVHRVRCSDDSVAVGPFASLRTCSEKSTLTGSMNWRPATKRRDGVFLSRISGAHPFT